MRKRMLGSIGKRALVALLALCMSLMMVPSVAFANEDADKWETYEERDTYQVDVNVNGKTESKTVDGDVSSDEGGVRAKATNGGSATVEVSGSVEAGDGSFGTFVSARGANSQATATVGNVSAGAGVHVDASAGNATLNAGDVKATAEDAENIDCNTFIASKGGTVTAQLGDVESAYKGLVLDVSFSGGSVSVKAGMVEAGGTGVDVSDGGGKATATVDDVFSNGTALYVINEGGEAAVTVNGDALSFANYGLVYMNRQGGEAKVVVSGTLSGAKNGVVLASKESALDLTAWKIESESGSVISGLGVDTFAKTVNYIVRVEQLVEGGTIAAFKADGSALDEHEGYSVAREGDKIILKANLQEGYELQGVYNGMSESVPLAKDENGNYYLVVERGGGIYLYAILGEANEAFTVIPPIEALLPSGTDEPVADNGNAGPLLTYEGVEINEVKLQMDGQTPVLRTILSNTNGRDVTFDCKKFKVVKVSDGSEVAFKTEPKDLKANESNAKFEFKAEENALQAGDRVFVCYGDQLLGTFAVA